MFNKVSRQSVWLVVLCGLNVACSRDPEPVAAVQQPQATAAGAAAGTQALSISFQMNPDPPQAGDNKVEVSVKQADGTPLTDATVTAVFYMPAMPSMSMPEMRSTFALSSAGNGIYRGTGDLVMSGTWDVTVNVVRGQEKVGSKKLTVIAK